MKQKEASAEIGDYSKVISRFIAVPFKGRITDETGRASAEIGDYSKAISRFIAVSFKGRNINETERGFSRNQR